MRWHAFLPNATQQAEQQEKKSLKAQRPENDRDLSVPLPVPTFSVADEHKRCSTSSSAYCHVPISGRSRYQTTMYEMDTTEQQNGGDGQ